MSTLYLSSLSNISQIPNNAIKLFIARQPFTNMQKYECKHIMQLAPSEKLLKDYKGLKINWRDYVKQFRQEMFHKQDILDYMYNRLQQEDLAIICYCGCKSDKHCHRYLIGDYFQELDINVVDIGKD